MVHDDDSVRAPTLQRWAGLLAVLILAIIAILWGRPSFSNASRAVRGVTNPLLAMEVVRNVSEVDAILSDAPSPDREVMRIKEYAQFAFIGCYGSLLVALSLIVKPRRIALAAAALGVIAAISGVIGTLAILRLIDVDLNHTTQAMIDGVRYPSLIEWTLASVSLGVLAVLLLRTPGRGVRIVAALAMAAALLGLLGLVDNRLLAWSGHFTLGAFGGFALLWFRPSRRRRGAVSDGNQRF
jgi:hypothetical protein